MVQWPDTEKDAQMGGGHQQLVTICRSKKKLMSEMDYRGSQSKGFLCFGYIFDQCGI